GTSGASRSTTANAAFRGGSRRRRAGEVADSRSAGKRGPASRSAAPRFRNRGLHARSGRSGARFRVSSWFGGWLLAGAWRGGGRNVMDFGETSLRGRGTVGNGAAASTSHSGRGAIRKQMFFSGEQGRGRGSRRGRRRAR